MGVGEERLPYAGGKVWAEETGFVQVMIEVNLKDVISSGNFADVSRILNEHPELANELIDDKFPFEVVAEKGFGNILNLLIQCKGFNVNPPGKSLLRTCIEFGYADLAVKLIEMGANPNVREEGEQTLLLFSLRKGFTDVAGKLIEAGAEVDARDDRGWTALVHASFMGWCEIVDFLLEHGARVNVATNDGWTALVEKKKKGHASIAEKLVANGAVFGNAFAQAALIAAYKNRNLAMMKSILKQGVSPNCMFDDENSLMAQAGWDEEWEYVKVLLEYGADPNTKLSSGQTILHRACWRLNLDLVQVLIEKGASVNCEFGNEYPIHVVAKLNGIELARLLLNSGASANLRNSSSETPLMLAANFDNLKMCKLLVEYGASANFRNNEGCTAYRYAPCASKSAAYIGGLSQ